MQKHHFPHNLKVVFYVLLATSIFTAILTAVYSYNSTSERLVSSYQKRLDKRMILANKLMKQLDLNHKNNLALRGEDLPEDLWNEIVKEGLTLYVYEGDDLAFWLNGGYFHEDLGSLKESSEFRLIEARGEQYLYKYKNYRGATDDLKELRIYVLFSVESWKTLTSGLACGLQPFPYASVVEDDGYPVYDLNRLCLFHIRPKLGDDYIPPNYLVLLYYLSYILFLLLLACLAKSCVRCRLLIVCPTIFVATLIVYSVSKIDCVLVDFIFDSSHFAISNLVPSLGHFIIYSLNAIFLLYTLLHFVLGGKNVSSRVTLSHIVTQVISVLCLVFCIYIYKISISNVSFSISSGYLDFFNVKKLVCLLILFLWMTVYFFVTFNMCLRLPRNDYLRKVLFGILGGVLVLLCSCVFAFPWWVAPFHVLLFLLVDKNVNVPISELLRTGLRYHLLLVLLGAVVINGIIYYYNEPLRVKMVETKIMGLNKTMGNTRDFLFEYRLQEISNRIDSCDILDLSIAEAYGKLILEENEIKASLIGKDFRDYDTQLHILLLDSLEASGDMSAETGIISRIAGSKFWVYDGGERYEGVFNFHKDSRFYLKVTLGLTIEAKKQRLNKYVIKGLKDKRMTLLNSVSYGFYEDGELVYSSGGYQYPMFDHWLKLYTKKGSDSHKLLRIKDGEYTHWEYNSSNGGVLLLTEFGTPEYHIISLNIFIVIFFYFSSLIMVWLYTYVVECSKHKSLIYSLMRRVGLLFTICLSCVALASIYYNRVQYLDNVKTDLQRYGDLVANKIQKVFIEDVNIEDVLDKIHNMSDILGAPIYMYGINGHLIEDLSFNRQDESQFDEDLKLIDATVLTSFAKNSRSRLNVQEFVYGYISFEYYGILYDKQGAPLFIVNIPFERNLVELDLKISRFLSIVLNIFFFLSIIFLFILSGVSRKISHRFNIIQQSLSNLRLGNKAIPLHGGPEDEIGQLVKEYNNMIHKLEESTKRLAETERESAWRIMAKQIAHEIKNPLTPMKLSLQQLKRTKEVRPEDFSTYFDRQSTMLIEQIDHLAKIADTFSQFSQITDGSVGRCDIVHLLNSLSMLYNVYKNVEVTIVSSSAKVCCNGSVQSVNQVFTNVLNNAYQAARPEVMCKIKCVVETKDDYCLVSISNNGYKIPDDQVDDIFKPRFTTKSSGMGLGLAIVRKIMTSIGGDIWFESSEEETTFYIRLLYDSCEGEDGQSCRGECTTKLEEL